MLRQDNNDDLSAILEGLNQDQETAVTAPPEHRLVLAGAGSGKTRVLIRRIAWLMQVEGVSPFGLLAVTFTNKAAGEMRGRLQALLQQPVDALWVGTFHGIAHRMLRMHWREAGLQQNFQIMDADDQKRFIKRLIKTMDMDESQWPARQVQGYINRQKEAGVRPGHQAGDEDEHSRQLQVFYSAYEDARERAGLLDFAELLLRAHELCRDNPDIQAHYRRRFRHILVDEFQDTNALQYAWLQVLAGDQGKLFVVGDDDQSIYSFRGARIENILRFSRDYPGADAVRLEQNYRSTGNILNAANALISNNGGRLGKNLWTDGGDGALVRVYAAFNDYEEAEYVISGIRQWINEGGQRSDCAILYRSNAQSRLFEETLIRADIPYRVYGGLRFFERAEIKDALAYLRLINNRDDDAAFERVSNTPARGIGATSMDKLRRHARDQGLSMWDAAQAMASGTLGGRAAKAIGGFLQLIEELAVATEDLTLSEMTREVVQASGLHAHHGKERGDKALSRQENLDELASAAKGFEDLEDDDLTPLTAFLTHAALEAGEDQGDRWEDCVQLMTLHAAKGLEFPVVYLVGLEEGLFPHMRSVDSSDGLEEERRLCYVGMTRAREHLHITHAESRRLHGREMPAQPSRFLAELPADCVEEIRPRLRVSQPRYQPRGEILRGNFEQQPAQGGFKLGQHVQHGKFGDGVILRFEGEGPRARVEVNFSAVGSKWLLLELAQLSPA
ncbi:DNA-dependent helicase II [Oceanococcus atlanticus]|uniref:DNA 3'-5' helicase n=1 Tax=Oceanococcus atlanticus TaxID=1317117 RepID=A0A1Y1SJM3_9GAMM|nr:DNA helicase II [Oceanococcus atlanticus]ORE89399.1 DNA-dependent helicase II [Oceanococcus atlanticus]